MRRRRLLGHPAAAPSANMHQITDSVACCRSAPTPVAPRRTRQAQRRQHSDHRLLALPVASARRLRAPPHRPGKPRRGAYPAARFSSSSWSITAEAVVVATGAVARPDGAGTRAWMRAPGP